MDARQQTEIPGSRPVDDEYQNEDEIIGYVEPWVASPGQEVAVKVSSTVPAYSWKLVRIIQGLQLDHAPPIQQEDVLVPSGNDAVKSGTYQKANSGSFARIDAWSRLGSQADEIQGVSVEMRVQPWLLDCDHAQTLFSTLEVDAAVGFAVIIALSGNIHVLLGDGKAVRTFESDIRLRRWRWADLSLTITRTGCKLQVDHRGRLAETAPRPQSFVVPLSLRSVAGGNTPLTFAAGFFGDGGVASSDPSSYFNGRLDSPHVQVSVDSETYRTWAQYNFALDIPSDSITDVSGSGRHGVLINAPTRAVKGAEWDGSEPDWVKAKYGYGAIHFHEDDLDDADWKTDFTVTIPEDAISGAYAVVVAGTEKPDVVDEITFFVRPPSNPDRKTPKTAMVLSTFTYLAYANEHMYDQDRASRMTLSGGVQVLKSQHWRRMARRTDLGLGLYDVHRDGSGTVFTSAKRPILNIRPGYVNWAFHRPREFSADQLMLGFLENTLGRGGYDVLTDHDLHLRGVDCLAGYDVVITGCHPEYPSLQSLNAYAAFARDGGNIMYLGGNGFYWTSATDPQRPHRMEVRRGDQGCRSFGMPAGERTHSLTGEQGGLWRGRGRNPQSLFGIGSCACGSGPGVPYRATEDAAVLAKFRWVFDGLQGSSSTLPLIGTHGFGGGASGDEIDRLDFDLGSPSNTVLLATSTGHDETFAVFNEEIMFPMVDTLGPTCDKVRSDMTYYETSGGGAVFSVGSINWYCSLGWDGYKNSIATVTGNVLKEFLKRGRRGSARV